MRALEDPGYYAARYAETHTLRESLAERLMELGWEVVPGCANFLLAHLPATGPTADELVKSCRQCGLFLRNAANMSSRFGDRVIRLAVKDEETNGRTVEILRALLGQTPPVRSPLARLHDAKLQTA